jgi:hypothetical protein
MLTSAMNQNNSKEQLDEISEVYSLLKKDAKLLIEDLYDGVSLWKSFSNLLFWFSVLGVWLVYIAIFPTVLLHGYTIVAIISALGLIGAGTAGSIMSRRRYTELKRKYSELFQSAKKLD